MVTSSRFALVLCLCPLLGFAQDFGIPNWRVESFTLPRSSKTRPHPCPETNVGRAKGSKSRAYAGCD